MKDRSLKLLGSQANPARLNDGEFSCKVTDQCILLQKLGQKRFYGHARCVLTSVHNDNPGKFLRRIISDIGEAEIATYEAVSLLLNVECYSRVFGAAQRSVSNVDSLVTGFAELARQRARQIFIKEELQSLAGLAQRVELFRVNQVARKGERGANIFLCDTIFRCDIGERHPTGQLSD
jgi:hypothetical protein